MRHLVAGAAIVLASVAGTETLPAASFNCDQDLSPVERMIFADATLGSADENLAQAYKDLHNIAPEDLADQRQWLIEASIF